ncbi:ClpP/crotonase [Gonapodya prolifera JEL478]|uniref:ClpP/crotonase n=1 Tax=Gonapodya prolifera (strain JEL478) TaxID=1344416 RepID=A0A139A5T7_GONPJ|nr:ClpP/crotonase [Gonapodya prolifera JEL478]|eukprot:KXS12192.1 ClpP/crotonase [Gonapodya prolifera JEL478]
MLSRISSRPLHSLPLRSAACGASGVYGRATAPTRKLHHDRRAFHSQQPRLDSSPTFQAHSRVTSPSPLEATSNASAVVVNTDPNTGIATLTLRNNPVNSLTTEFMSEIAAAVQELSAGYPDVDGGARALLVRSECKAFSAGLNLESIAGASEESLRPLSLALRKLVLAFLTTPLPTVAEVTGSAIAGGAVIAMLCDQRVGLNDAKMRIGLSETSVGLPPPRFVTALAEDILGKRGAYRHLMLGSLLSPEDALTAGYLDAVHADQTSVSSDAQSRLTHLARIQAHARYSAKLQLRRSVFWALGEDEDAFVAEMWELVSDPRTQEAVGRTWEELQKKKRAR